MNIPIRLVIADDHRGIRSAVRAATSRQPEIEVVAEARTGAETLDACRSHAPDVLLLDLSMPGPPANAIVYALKAIVPLLRVLVLTANSSRAVYSIMVHAGVAGYICKDDAADELIPAILAVARGGTWYRN